MTRARATLRDVAERVGVHSSTVSRAMNPKTRQMVSEAVAQRVLEAANEMGYQANPFALSLKTNRSFTVGVLIPDITNPVFPPIIRGIEKTLGPAGYIAILADSDNNPDMEGVFLQQMKARQVDGLILATAHRADDIIRDCIEGGIAFVLINRTVESEGVYSVTNDDATGIRLAVDHVADLGHRHIAHLAGPQDLSTGHDRYLGFVAAMKARGLDLDSDLVLFARSFSENAGRRGMAALLNTGKSFTAVISGNDMLALGCYDELEARGINCPAEISVTGFNDMPFVDKFKPPMTTIRIPHYEMGATAAQILLQMMGDDKGALQSVQQTPELIVRGSTAKAPA